MTDQFDLIVPGSGPGGYVAAIRASQLGLKTAIVERENLGGICLNWGCIPTKALLRTSEIYHYMKQAEKYGLSVEKPSFDLEKVIGRSRGVAKQLNQGVTGLMKKNKVIVYFGDGKLTGKGKLSVTKDGKATDLEAKNIIIATGARARDLPFAKADGKRIWTYRHAMTPPEMPTKLLVIGSGAIGIEFASFYNDMGAKVTVVEMLDRILPVEDAEISDFMTKALTKQGMDIRASTGVQKITDTGKAITAEIKGKDGKVTTEEFSHVIVAVGIVPNVENIGLEDLGIEPDQRFHIKTDEYCRTNVPGVYAVAGAQGESRRRDRGRAYRRPASAPDGPQQYSGLHLLPSASGVGWPHRSQGEGSGLQGQGRQIPIHRQWQGHRAG
jgi:dihydrolipoamide dehydrogenase